MLIQRWNKRAIKRALEAGRFTMTLHAIERMDERSVTRADIVTCGRTMRSCRYQPEQDTFLVHGLDLDNVDLTVICGIDKDLVIVTVF